MGRNKGVTGRLPGRRKQFRSALGWNMINGTLLIMEAWAVARIVNEAFLGEGDWPSLSVPLFGLLAIVVLRAVTHGAGEASALKLGLRMKGELRQQAAEKLAALGPRFAKGERSGELIHAVTEGLDQLEIYFARYIPQLAQTMFIPVAVLVATVGADWFSAVIFAVTLPLLILFMILVGKTAKWQASKQYKLLGRLSGHLFDVLRGLYTLTVFNQSKGQIGVIARMSEKHRKATMGTLRLAFLSAFVMELFATLSTAIVAVFLGLRLIEGGIGFEAAFFVLLLAPEYYQPVRTLGTQFHASQNGITAAERIYELLDAEPPGYPEREDGIVLPDREAGYRIVFDCVTVHYPGAEEPALADVSLVLEPGERVAIVGKTGAGKSTLLDLLQGFVRPTRGRITVDGVDMAELSMRWWRSKVAVVAQQVKLFPGTVRDNLLLADPAATEEALDAALWAAQADGWVGRLPQGLDTHLGESVRLSGGQIQRLGLARAMLKHAPLTLLDEPTASLDRETEEAVRLMVLARLAGRMSVTVAHRLETIREADRVIVLAEGRVRESGPPAELLSLGGLFADMVQAGRERLVVAGGAEGAEGAGGAGGTGGTGGAYLDAAVASPFDEEEEREAGSVRVTAGADLDAGDNQGMFASVAETEPSSRSVFRFMLGFLRPYKMRMLLALLLGGLTIAASVGLMATSGYLIAKAALRPETVLLLWIPIVGVRFFGISRGVFRYLERLVSHDLTFRILHRIRVWVYARVEPRGALLLEEERSGDLLEALVGDVEELQNLYLRVLAPPLIAVLITALGVGLMAAHHPLLAVVLLVMMVLAGVGIPLAGHLLGRRAGHRYVRAKAELSTVWSDLIGGLADWMTHGREQDAIAAVADSGARSDREQRSQNRLTAWLEGGMVLLMRLAMWFILALSVWLAGAWRVEPLYIASLVVTVLACFEAIVPLPQAFQFYGQTAAAAERLLKMTEQTADERNDVDVQDLLDRLEEREGQGSEKVPHSAELPGAAGVRNTAELIVSDLSYRYAPDEPHALRGLSLALRPGRRIAVVGESGAGKSTLMHVLLRLRDYEEGRVRLNGTDVRQMTAEQVRDQFAVVSQHVQLFNATVADNLRLGNPSASLADMREAARLALIDDTIMALPDGYDTIIGEWGSRLSGGERQRLALARALLRDAPFVLFDEPATGLDPLTEQALLDNLRHGLRDRAVLWITHQLTGLSWMDEIIVLHEGMAAERGTETELLARRGRYYRYRALEERLGV